MIMYARVVWMCSIDPWSFDTVFFLWMNDDLCALSLSIHQGQQGLFESDRRGLWNERVLDPLQVPRQYVHIQVCREGDPL